MREEEESNWFSQWEAQLPSPDELMPLSQSLITPDLALAFDIPPPPSSSSAAAASPSSVYPPPSTSLNYSNTTHQNSSPPAGGDVAESDYMGGGGAGADEPARTLKRPRLVWTPQLHKRFVDAVAHLGIKNAVPKTIMQLMSVDGLTRENVASHLQKYRLYLKRMQGLSSSAAAGGAAAGPMSAADAAEHHLFASGPLPHHFLHRGGSGTPTGGVGQEHYLPYVPLPSLHHHQHHSQQIAAAAQYYNSRHFGQFGSPPGGGQFDHGFLSRQPHQLGAHHPIVGAAPSAANYGEDLELGAGGGGDGRRKILTLFPTGDD